jgi:transaldolase
MSSGYFHRVTAETSTRLWINNPSEPELELSVASGAINCTTNPAYCSKLLDSDREYLQAVIDEIILGVRDDEAAANRVYEAVSARVMRRFLPLYEQSGGAYGYVTMQGDPRLDENTSAIVASALRWRQLGPNFMAKIPVIPGGLEAIEACVEHNLPICATEVFSIAQAIAVCELYQRAAARTGNHPPFFVTHITGILDEYLQKVAKRDRIAIEPGVLAQAGCAVARKEYHLLKQRGYSATLLGGGARGVQHFTEFVGGDAHITINWSTAKELIDADTRVVSRIDVETPQAVIEELCANFPDFRRAYADDGLALGEYAGYGPVQLFRNAFLKGWYLLLAEVCSRLNAAAW